MVPAKSGKYKRVVHSDADLEREVDKTFRCDERFVPQGSSVSSNPMQSLEHLSFPVAHMLFGAFGSERSLCTCA
eukprot:scaffold13906_cov17-Tisochrysis_lutea.AAC.1